MSRPTEASRILARAGRALFGTRSRAGEFLTRVAEIRVAPAYRGLRWLSATILVLLGIQFVTGVLLSLYYYPEPGMAYDSVRHLNGRIATGWIVRGVHHWAGDLIVLAVLGHLLFVFFRRAYSAPREYEWVVGVLLLPAVFAFRFTGRLLPWDTLGLDASRRGLDLLATLPIVGSWAARWLRGGEDLGANTLSRFFTTHVLILPWVVFGLFAVHFYLVLRHGLKETRE